MTLYRRSEVARLSYLSIRQVQCYDGTGFIKTNRPKNQPRRYTAEQAVQLQLIGDLLQRGLSKRALKQIPTLAQLNRAVKAGKCFAVVSVAQNEEEHWRLLRVSFCAKEKLVRTITQLKSAAIVFDLNRARRRLTLASGVHA